MKNKNLLITLALLASVHCTIMPMNEGRAAEAEATSRQVAAPPRAAESARATLLQLPEELIMYILSFLGAQAICDVRKVCKDLERLGKDQVVCGWADFVRRAPRYNPSEALILAAQKGNLHALHAINPLIAAGADVNFQNPNDKNTALIWAVRKGHDAVVEILITKGADFNYQNPNDGNTALICAAGNGHNAVFETLIAHGADVNLQNNDSDTALIWAARNGHNAAVQALLDANANVNLQNKFKGTALAYAVIKGHDAVVKTLIDKGADVNYQSSVWMKAAQDGHDAVVQRLLAKGADVNYQNKFRDTALIYAAENGHDAVVKTLIAVRGINIDQQNKFKDTALIWAVRKGHDAAVQALLAAGADRTLRNERGQTAEDLARAGDHIALANMIRDFGRA